MLSISGNACFYYKVFHDFNLILYPICSIRFELIKVLVLRQMSLMTLVINDKCKDLNREARLCIDLNTRLQRIRSYNPITRIRVYKLPLCGINVCIIFNTT